MANGPPDLPADDPPAGDHAAGMDDESPAERLNRNLDQLTQELRVALPGVQVLFAFLLVVPFNSRFDELTQGQREMYLVALMCACTASALLIAPSVHHRVLFHRRRKPELVRLGSRLAVAGMVVLVAAFTSSVALIASFIFTSTVSVLVTVGTLVMFGVTWFVVPLYLRERPGVDDC
jgi:hypothetical protein